MGRAIDHEDAKLLAPEIQAILNDVAGLDEARAALGDLSKTGFSEQLLDEILSAPNDHEEWRVGEALAEHHLAKAYGCKFPWPDSRSTRNPNSIGGGVDLIGFTTDGSQRFVFGEVKTSHQQSWPPSVVTSRSHGLQAQLAGIISADVRGKWAIKYLYMNSIGKTWHEECRLALQTYLADPSNVVVFGVLVHVAEPKLIDLRARAKNLAEDLPDPTDTHLIGIYPLDGVLVILAGTHVSIETAA